MVIPNKVVPDIVSCSLVYLLGEKYTRRVTSQMVYSISTKEDLGPKVRLQIKI